MGYQLTRRSVLLVWTVLIIIPLVVVVAGTFKTTPELFSSPFGLPSRPDLANYSQVLQDADLAGAFRNSVVVTLCSVVLTLFVAVWRRSESRESPAGRAGWSTAPSYSGWPCRRRPT
jgi:raffinose/stachyose/melibiose transport system permease protein